MTEPAVSLVCEGCGAVPPPLAEAPYPFRCARAGLDTIDHVVAPHVNASRASWPTDTDDRPFVRYRTLLHAHAAARELGLGDAGYLAILERLDAAITRVDGRSFRTTPLVRSPAIAEALHPEYDVWIKDETRNVSGSHKARHLFGVLLHLEIARAAGLEPIPPPPLAIASCGNAALAAAVLAAAAERRLSVMVPPDAHPAVLGRLRDLGADVHVIPRAPGELGDPTLHAFRQATAAGALPFACQGTECGLTLDGGKTLGFELASSAVPFDRLFLQIGGGALASSVARALADAHHLGALPRMPRLMAVQTTAVAPLSAAYARLVEAVRSRLRGPASPDVHLRGGESAGPDVRLREDALTASPGDALADRLRAPDIAPIVRAVLDDMTRDRAAWLPPWPDPRPSRAHGILDDETYDALAILRAMIATGGSPVVVDETTVIEAEQLGRTATSIDVDATGTAGLAGLMAWSRRGDSAKGERIALLLTGARR